MTSANTEHHGVVAAVETVLGACLIFLWLLNTSAGAQERDTRFIVQKGRPGVIIFIHGLRGSAEKTWLNEATGTYWPRLMAEDRQFDPFDIYTVNYKAGQNIEELTTQLISELEPLFQTYDRIVFLSHSMGGLIAKNLLIKLLTTGNVKKLQQVKAIVSLGTPAQGADGAWWLHWFNWDPQITDLIPGDKNTFLQSLDNNWGALIRRRNELGWKFPKSYCAYETKSTKGIPIVDRTSAHTWCDTDMQGMAYNHIDLVKPASRSQDIRYEWTRDRIFEATHDPSAGVPPKCDQLVDKQHSVQGLNPRIRVSVFKHDGNEDAYGQVIGLLKDRLITIREKLYDSKDAARQYLSLLTECPLKERLPADEQVRQQMWNETYSLELVDGVVFQEPTGALARSRIYLGTLGGELKEIPLEIRVTPDTFGTFRDLYSLTTIYALLMDAKRIEKPSAVRLHYLHVALGLSKDLGTSTETMKRLQRALEQEAKALKSKSIR